MSGPRATRPNQVILIRFADYNCTNYVLENSVTQRLRVLHEREASSSELSVKRRVATTTLDFGTY